MSIALVQATNKDVATATSTTISYGSNNTSGNLLVCCVRVGNNGATVSITDSRSNSWSVAINTDNAANGRCLATLYAMNCGAGANTLTISITGAAATMRIWIAEYSGIATTSALDQKTGTTGTSANPASGAVTTLTASELLIGAFERGGGDTFTAGSGWAFETNGQVPAAPSTWLGVESQIVSSTGSYNATGTITSAGWTAQISTFTAAGGGGNTFVPLIGGPGGVAGMPLAGVGGGLAG